MDQLRINLTAWNKSDGLLWLTKTIAIPRTLSYDKFIEELNAALEVEGKLIHSVKYMDEENELVSVTNDSDLSIGLRIGEKLSTLYVHVYTDNMDSVSEETEDETTLPKCGETTSQLESQSGGKLSDRARLCRKVEKKVRRLQNLVRNEDGLKGEIRNILNELERSHEAEEKELRSRLEQVQAESKQLHAANLTQTQPAHNESATTSCNASDVDLANSTTTLDSKQNVASTLVRHEFWARIIDSEKALIDAVSERLLLQLNNPLQMEAKGEMKAVKENDKLKPRLQFSTLCNSCGKLVTDTLYRCVTCKFFNLCERCESEEKWFAHENGDHLFVKVRRPLSVRQTAVLTTKLPLIDKSFFTDASRQAENSVSRVQYVRFCSDEIINTKLNERELITFRWIERKRSKRVAKLECCRKISDRVLESFQRAARERLQAAADKQAGVCTFFDKSCVEDASKTKPKESEETLSRLSAKVAKCFLKEEKQRLKLGEMYARVASKLERSSTASASETFDLRGSITSLRLHYANKLARRSRKQPHIDSTKRSSDNQKQMEILRELVRRCDSQLELLDTHAQASGSTQLSKPNSTSDPVIATPINQSADLIELNSESKLHKGEEVIEDLWLATLRRMDVTALCAKLNHYASKLGKRVHKMDTLRDRLDVNSKKAGVLFQRALNLHERLTEAGQRTLASEPSYQTELLRAQLLVQLELVNAKNVVVQRTIDTANTKLSKSGRKASRLRSKMTAIAAELDARGERATVLGADAELDARITEWSVAKRDAKLKELLRKIDSLVCGPTSNEVETRESNGLYAVEQLRLSAKVRKFELKAERKRNRLHLLRGAQVIAPLRIYDSRFVDDVTVPDGERVAPGATFTKSWRVANCGAAMWHAESVQLDCVDYDDSACLFEASFTELQRYPVEATLSNDETVVSVELRAPLRAGAVRSTWQLRSKDGRFGDRMWCLVEVEDDEDAIHSGEHVSASARGSVMDLHSRRSYASMSKSTHDHDSQKTEAALQQSPAEAFDEIDQHEASASDETSTESTISRRNSYISAASSSVSDDFVKLPVPLPDCFNTSEEERRIQQLAMVRALNAPPTAFQEQMSDSGSFATSQPALEMMPLNVDTTDEFMADGDSSPCRNLSEKRTHLQAFGNESSSVNQPVVNDESLAALAQFDEDNNRESETLSDYQIVESRSQSISDLEASERETAVKNKQVDERPKQLLEAETELVNLSAQLANTHVDVNNATLTHQDSETELNRQTSADVPDKRDSTRPGEPLQTSIKSGDQHSPVPLSKFAQNALTLAGRAVSIAYDVYTSMQARERFTHGTQSQASSSSSLTNAIQNDVTSPAMLDSSNVTQAASSSIPASAQVEIAVKSEVSKPMVTQEANKNEVQSETQTPATKNVDVKPTTSAATPRPLPYTSSWVPTPQQLPSVITGDSNWQLRTSQWTPPPPAPVQLSQQYVPRSPVPVLLASPSVAIPAPVSLARSPLPQSLAPALPPRSPIQSPPAVPARSPVSQIPEATSHNSPSVLTANRPAPNSDSVDRLTLLQEMGFTNRKRNAELLRRFHEDINVVISELVSESENDWYVYRN